MLRLLKEAFWLRVPVAALGALPVNVLALSGIGILGFAEHAFWLLGAGAEAAYLLAMVTNARFQRVVAARELAGEQAAATTARQELLRQLPPESRARLETLEGKVAQVATLYRTDPDDGLLADSNLDALGQLAALYARLLGAERHLRAARAGTDPAALARQAAGLRRDLDNPGALTESLRESKRATLELVQKRLANAEARERSLAETASDLARIESQVDLALEEAGLRGSRAPAAGSLNLFNEILASNTALAVEEDPVPRPAAPPPSREPPLAS